MTMKKNKISKTYSKKYLTKITYPLKPFFDFPASEVFDVEVDFPEASPLTFSPDSENIKKDELIPQS